MPVNDHDTISSLFIREALDTCDLNTDEGVEVLHAAGIPVDILDAPASRVAPQIYSRFWSLLADHLDDELFAADSHGMRRGTFTMLCHCVLGAETLGQALQRAVRFLNLVLDDYQGHVHRERGLVRLEVIDRCARKSVFILGTYLKILYELGCWLIKRRVPILQCHFQASRPEIAEEYALVFGRNVGYDKPLNTLVLDAQYLELPVRQTTTSLKAFLRGAPATFLLRYRDPDAKASQVRRLMRQHAFNSWPDFKEVAQRLHMSESTLRRRLEEEGLSFQAIKDQLRRDRALFLLQTSDLPISHVADLLGFNEPSTFHRAFKKWTGLSPSSFRQGSAQRPR